MKSTSQDKTDLDLNLKDVVLLAQMLFQQKQALLNHDEYEYTLFYQVFLVHSKNYKDRENDAKHYY